MAIFLQIIDTLMNLSFGREMIRLMQVLNPVMRGVVVLVVLLAFSSLAEDGRGAEEVPEKQAPIESLVVPAWCHL